MRVAFVTFEYPPFIIGGAGVHALHVTEELAKLGNQVVVFTPAIGNTDNTEHPPGANLQVWHVPVREAIPSERCSSGLIYLERSKRRERGKIRYHTPQRSLLLVLAEEALGGTARAYGPSPSTRCCRKHRSGSLFQNERSQRREWGSYPSNREKSRRISR